MPDPTGYLFRNSHSAHEMALAAQRNQCAAWTTGARPHRVAPRIVCSTASYQAPSNVTAANTLQALARMSNVVPDSILLESSVPPKAVTVSSLLLSWILSNEQLGNKPYQVIQRFCNGFLRLESAHWMQPCRNQQLNLPLFLVTACRTPSRLP